MKRSAALIWLATSLPALAAPPLPLPGEATETRQSEEPALRAATGPFSEGHIPVIEAHGTALHQAYRLTGTAASPRDLLTPAREALIDQGYEILYECSADDCGGFDFRFSLPVLPEPDMHIDLGRYRYLSARKDDRLIALWASRAPEAGFIQISAGEGPLGLQREASLQIPSAPDPATPRPGRKPDAPTVTAPTQTAPAPAAPTTGAADSPANPSDIFATGHLVLEGVDFAAGSHALIDPDAPVLTALADWLAADANRALVLVGHTDATGSLSGNIAVSKARAEAVRARLITAHGIAPDRLSTEGAGWLSPRASNATEEGRALNRRVEALPR